MQSGIEWDEENYDESNNSCILMEGSNNWIQFVLNHPMDTIPGSVFEYNSGASVLLGKIVREATGKRIDKWAEERLFNPLRIKQYYWKETPLGEIDTEGGLYLTPLDLAKIGYLMLHKGKWEGKQLVSKTWAEKSVEPMVAVNERIGYGYQWWIPYHKEGKAEIFGGNGYGGQLVTIAPKYNMVLVMNGWNIHDQTEKFAYWIFEQRIIPNTQL